MAKELKSIARLACMVIFLTVFNIAFWTIGLVIFVLGLYLKFELQEYSGLHQDTSNCVLFGMAGLGAVVIIAATFACCYTARQHPVLLYLYGVFLALVVILEIGIEGSIYSYRNTLMTGYDRTINESMWAFGSDHHKSAHMDFLQSTLHCCGKNAYTDWMKMTPPRQIPESCCSVQRGECDMTDVLDIYTTGCYNRVVDFMFGNVAVVILGALLIVLFPLLGLLLTCCLARHISKANCEEAA